VNLADLEPDRRAALLTGARPVRIARNEPAYVPGDPADTIYFVRSGRIKIVRTSPSGAESIVGSSSTTSADR
jgi:CRP-like cAMP-binding protein